MTTATLLLLPAAHATSQEVVDSTQDNPGAISATQVLNVVENDGLTSAQTQASGNALQGGNQQVDATLTARQTNRGNITGTTTVNGTNTGQEDLSLGTPLYITTQATANYTSSVADQANLTANTTQTSTAATVHADTQINSGNNAVYVSGEGDAISETNHVAYEVTNGRLVATAVQDSSSESRARVGAIVHYSPSDNLYASTATNNSYASNSDDRGSQDHTVTQTAAANTQAYTSLNGGNMWTSAGTATATANSNNLHNQGGSLTVANTQTQSGPVLSQAVVTADQYGTATASASGTGNMLAAGDNDVYVRVDNTQLSTGGVDVQASFTGNNGYDSYVTADAVGNQALAYACAECKADMAVNNNQTNASDVNATATTTINGQGRSTVTTARAIGNSATYYVSGGKGN